MWSLAYVKGEEQIMSNSAVRTLRGEVVTFDYTYSNEPIRQRYAIVIGIDYGSPNGIGPDRFHLRCIAMDLEGRPERSFDMVRIVPESLRIV